MVCFSALQQFGRVMVEPLGLEPCLGGAVQLFRERLHWYPPTDWPGIGAAEGPWIDSLRDDDGYRRFLPGSANYVDGAFQFGELAMALDPSAPPVKWWPKQILDLLAPSHLFLRRNFSSARDLFVAFPSRAADDDTTVLSPATLGDVDCQWPNDFVALGRRLARAAGYARPAKKKAIEYAFMESARRRPLPRPSGKELELLFRGAFFDRRKLPQAVSEDVQAEVQARFISAVARNTRLGSEHFKGWFDVSHGNVLKSIGTMAKRPLGTLERGVVKAALLELLWRERSHVVAPLDCFASMFARSLPEALRPDEARQFFGLFGGLPQFANLPLVLWPTCRAFARPVVAMLWQNPDDETALGMLYRLLQIYGDMSVERRDADVRGTHHRTSDGCKTKKLNERSKAFDGMPHNPLATLAEPGVPLSSEVTQALELIVEGREHVCPRCGKSVLCEYDPDQSLTGTSVEFVVNCQWDDYTETSTATREELKAAVKRIRELNRKG